MLENTAVKLAATKLTNSSLVSGSLILVGGMVAWRLWSKQEHLETITKELSRELKGLKKQVAEISGNGEGKAKNSLFKKLFS